MFYTLFCSLYYRSFAVTYFSINPTPCSSQNLPFNEFSCLSLLKCLPTNYLPLCSDIHIRSNISCPVSPCGSPLLRSRSPQHQNGRMSPSPISSPRTTSGASTPLTGGSGAVPLNHLRQPAYRNEGFTITSRGFDDHIPSRPVDPVHGRFIRVQQFSAGHQERVVSEADILSSQFGKMRHANVWDSHDRPLHSERSSQQCFGDHVKLKPSLDLRSGPRHPGRNHGH